MLSFNACQLSCAFMLHGVSFWRGCSCGSSDARSTSLHNEVLPPEHNCLDAPRVLLLLVCSPQLAPA